MHDIFISHCEADRAVADAVCAAVERAGLLCLRSGDPPGESRIFLLILSAASVESAEVAADAQSAAGRPAILFRIEDVEPSAPLSAALGEAQCLDALPPPIEPHLDYLGAIIGRLLEGGDAALMRPLTQPPAPMPPRPAARAWLPILLAGLAGLIAIAAVAWTVAR